MLKACVWANLAEECMLITGLSISCQVMNKVFNRKRCPVQFHWPSDHFSQTNLGSDNPGTTELLAA